MEHICGELGKDAWKWSSGYTNYQDKALTPLRTDLSLPNSFWLWHRNSELSSPSCLFLSPVPWGHLGGICSTFLCGDVQSPWLVMVSNQVFFEGVGHCPNSAITPVQLRKYLYSFIHLLMVIQNSLELKSLGPGYWQLYSWILVV